MYDPTVFASKSSDAENDALSSGSDQCTVAAAYYGFFIAVAAGTEKWLQTPNKKHL